LYSTSTPTTTPRLTHSPLLSLRYPNIILTNRLQPSAIVTQADCAACDFNSATNGCKRPMEWTWRGDYLPATLGDYRQVQHQFAAAGGENGEPWGEVRKDEQARLIKNRLRAYSRTVYHKTKVTEEVDKVDTVCMRENPFYVNTVRDFRDRRYVYKGLTKSSKKELSTMESAGDVEGAKGAFDKVLLYDSLQLAHKCILNSFYGYVMRKGARWRSMPMAAIVTLTGATLITKARELVEQLGRPLELDTDGIWLILPKSFPENFKLNLAGGGSVGVEYPCLMLNADVHDNYTNHQYQALKDPATQQYDTQSECSIFFEVDGPYRAMVLPASTEEGKLLKKKYVWREERACCCH